MYVNCANFPSIKNDAHVLFQLSNRLLITQMQTEQTYNIKNYLYHTKRESETKTNKPQLKPELASKPIANGNI